jgi:hypothetical protein
MGSGGGNPPAEQNRTVVLAPEEEYVCYDGIKQFVELLEYKATFVQQNGYGIVEFCGSLMCMMWVEFGILYIHEYDLELEDTEWTSSTDVKVGNYPEVQGGPATTLWSVPGKTAQESSEIMMNVQNQTIVIIIRHHGDGKRTLLWSSTETDWDTAFDYADSCGYTLTQQFEPYLCVWEEHQIGTVNNSHTRESEIIGETTYYRWKQTWSYDNTYTFTINILTSWFDNGPLIFR